MTYRGISRDVTYNPWVRLIHGKKYTVIVHKFKNGKVRVDVTDDFDRCRLNYDSKRSFDLDWCK